jgi:hypothetical protein
MKNEGYLRGEGIREFKEKENNKVAFIGYFL